MAHKLVESLGKEKSPQKISSGLGDVGFVLCGALQKAQKDE